MTPWLALGIGIGIGVFVGLVILRLRRMTITRRRRRLAAQLGVGLTPSVVTLPDEDEFVWDFKPAPAEFVLLEEDERRLAHELATMAHEGHVVVDPLRSAAARRLADKTS